MIRPELIEKAARAAQAAATRFWSKVSFGDCWEWGAALSDGYGNFWDGARSIGAHRWSYEHLVGPIPAGLTLDHLCRNRACVNPDHLEPVTNAENIRRGASGAINGHRAASRTHCPKGHPYSPSNTYVWVTPDGRPNRRCRTCNSEHQKIGYETLPPARCDICEMEVYRKNFARHLRTEAHRKQELLAQRFRAEGAAQALRDFADRQDSWCDAGREEQIISRGAMRDALRAEADRLEARDE